MFSEAMLSMSDDGMFVKIIYDLGMNDMLQCLTTNGC